MSAQDMQLMEHMNMGLDDVARFFGTPRPLLMLDTNSHYTTYTNATLEYLQRTVQPDITEMEQEMNRKLLTRDDFGSRRIHMCEQPLLRLDKEAQAKVDQLQLQTGAATVNEIRAQYDRPAVEGGDIIYVSTNLAELGSPKLSGAQPTPPTEPNPEEK
jgi:HK97 family phage portal protein